MSFRTGNVDLAKCFTNVYFTKMGHLDGLPFIIARGMFSPNGFLQCLGYVRSLCPGPPQYSLCLVSHLTLRSVHVPQLYSRQDQTESELLLKQSVCAVHDHLGSWPGYISVLFELQRVSF